jgi:hypothetical protein
VLGDAGRYGRQVMGTTYRFIADPTEESQVLQWMRSLNPPPIESRTNGGVVLYFKHLGPLIYDSKGGVDASQSPTVSIVHPRIRRSKLWTVGEVHFLATSLRKTFPELQKVSTAFLKFLSSCECVYSNRRNENPFEHYLRGSIMNFDSPVYAFESGMTAINNSQFFVADDDSDWTVELVCRSLSLLGIECGP